MDNSNNNTAGIISIICAAVAWFAFGLILSIAAIIAGAVGYKTTVGKIGLVIGVIEFIVMISWLS